MVIEDVVSFSNISAFFFHWLVCLGCVRIGSLAGLLLLYLCSDFVYIRYT